MKKNTITSFLILLFLMSSILSLNLFSQEKFGNRPRQERKVRRKPKAPDKNELERIKRDLGENWENIMLDMIKVNEPDEMGDLLEEKKKNPAKYYEKLVRTWEDVKRLNRFKNEDPKRYQQFKRQLHLDRECKNLARQYKKLKNNSKKAAIRTQLKNRLSEFFELREAEKTDKIKELEHELEKLKEMVKFRDKNKDKIIEKRLNEMLDGKKQLEW